MSAIQHAMKYAMSLDFEERANVSMTYFYEAAKKEWTSISNGSR
jgi:hypothetical protein